MGGKKTVLFLCSANSARSLMAEAFLRHHAGDRFEAISAGLRPTQPHPLTLRVLEEKGIDPSGLRSKDTREYLAKVQIHYAVVVCEQAAQHCPQFYPFTVNNLYWPFDDPAAVAGSEAERLAAFRRVRDEIELRVLGWLDEFNPSEGGGS